jgi:hypothetical protein
MEEKIKVIEENCGTKPIGEEFIERIENDPNFVFQNDPNFETLRLFDVDNNIVNVNSWIECAHYVSGGWGRNSTATFSGDLIYLFIVVGITITYSVIRLYLKKLSKNEN